MGFAGLQLAQGRFLGLGLEPAGLDLFGRQHALGVEPDHAPGLALGLLGLGGLLVDLGPEQGVVELDQRLALLHPGALLHIDPRHPVAREVRTDRGLLARDHEPRGGEPAFQGVGLHLHHHRRTRLLLRGRAGGRLARAWATAAVGQDRRRHREGQHHSPNARRRVLHGHLTPFASGTPCSALAA